MPSTSIIIVFHNEANSTLLRSLVSICTRSPLRLVKEIILVDDCSTQEHLKRPLEEFVKTLPVLVTILRNRARSGLIVSRLRGAQRAYGPILTFLDSHIEVNENWLPPLLAEIYFDRYEAPFSSSPVQLSSCLSKCWFSVQQNHQHSAHRHDHCRKLPVPRQRQ